MKSIWQRWKAHYKTLGIDEKEITKDGIIDESKFNNKRVLFILKDSNKFGGHHLKELFVNGPKYQMWHTTARWAYGIINNFPEYKKFNKNELKEALHSVAIINLKKKAGKSTAKQNIIDAYTHQDKALLLEQIKSINPKIIIGCGTFSSLIWLLDLPANGDNPNEKPLNQIPSIQPLSHGCIQIGKITRNLTID